MCSQKLYAGIVTYNPDISRFKENIGAIQNQVSRVVVFDNGSVNVKLIQEIISQWSNIVLIESNINIGIAAALNKLMDWGYVRKYEWMLSLDQDSVCDDNYVDRMKKYLTVESKLGIVAPVIIDRNVGVIGHNPRSEYTHVNTCITSGAFSNIKAWNLIGKYDESMFIDSVDFEFCYRMRKNGYGVIQVKDIKLLHEIGKSQKRKFLLWKVDVTGHSAFRKYYIARNNIYYPLKHGLWIYFIRGNFRNIWLIIITILYEQSKKENVSAICRGWKDAFKVRISKNGD